MNWSRLWIGAGFLFCLWSAYNFGYKFGLRAAPETIAAKVEAERVREERWQNEQAERQAMKDAALAAAGITDPYLMCEKFISDLEEEFLWRQQESLQEEYNGDYEGGGRVLN
jgi:hypothetical protein